MRNELATLSTELKQLRDRLRQLDKALSERDYLIRVDDQTLLLWEENNQITRWKGIGD
jgi:hypothetical protein